MNNCRADKIYSCELTQRFVSLRLKTKFLTNFYEKEILSSVVVSRTCNQMVPFMLIIGVIHIVQREGNRVKYKT